MFENLGSNTAFNLWIIIKKYWEILGKPVVIQSILAGILGSAVMLSLFNRIEIQAYVFIIMGVFIAHIVFRCIFGEDKQFDYNQDD
jgi:hypothetical protein